MKILIILKPEVALGIYTGLNVYLLCSCIDALFNSKKKREDFSHSAAVCLVLVELQTTSSSIVVRLHCLPICALHRLLNSTI